MHAAIALATATLVFGAPLHGAEEAPFVTTRVLSLDAANRLALGAAGECGKRGFQVAVAVVDRSGGLLAFARDPLAGPHTIDVSIGKAYAAASFQTSTAQMQEPRFAGLRSAPKVMLVGGGLPVRIGGHIYGAVGVSGAPAEKTTGDIDQQCAQAGIEAIREAIEFAQ
ncbi:MAG: heme-binding protein [Pseudomonadota bacterium]|nr:MAG: heme-binding protein [Pseudomonadota bacterium]